MELIIVLVICGAAAAYLIGKLTKSVTAKDKCTGCSRKNGGCSGCTYDHKC